MRLIDADAIKYEPLPKGERNYRTYNLDDAYEDGYNDAMVDVRNAPTIEERKAGKWIVSTMPVTGAIEIKCSECNTPYYMAFTLLMNYCPNCGASMKGESDE